MVPDRDERELFERAETHYSAGQFTSALDSYLAYLISRRSKQLASGKYYALDGLAMERCAALAPLFEQHRAARDVLEFLGEKYLEYGETFKHLQTVLLRVQIALDEADLRLAASLIASLSRWTGQGEPEARSYEEWQEWEEHAPLPTGEAEDRKEFLGLWYWLQGRMAASLGGYTAAEAAYSRGLRTATPEQLPLLQIWMARANLENGRIEEARSLFKDAKDSNYLSHKVMALQWLSKAAWMVGELGHGKMLLSEAIEACDRTDYQYARCGLRIQLAELLVLLNDLDAASGLLDFAGSLNARDGNVEIHNRAVRVRALIELRQAAPEFVTLPSVFEMQEGLRRSNGSPPASNPEDANRRQESLAVVFDDYYLEYLYFLGMRDKPRAEAIFKRLTDYADCDSGLIHGRYLVADGLREYAAGDYSRADDRFATAEIYLRKLNLASELRQLMRYRVWCCEGLNQKGRAERYRQQEMEILERLEASLDFADRGLFMANKSTQDEDRLEQDLNRCLALQNTNKPLRLRWAAVRLLERMDQHRAARACQAMGIPPLKNRQRWPWWIRAFLMPRHHATIAFCCFTEATAAITISRKAVRVFVHKINRTKLRLTVSRFHRLLLGTRGDETEEEKLASIGAELGMENMMGALAADLHSIRIQPDDILFALPFQALPVGGGKRMIDQWNISYGPDWYPALAKCRKGLALAAGAAVISGEKGLPEVADELSVVAKRITWARCEKNVAATSATVRNAIQGGVRVLHLAAHGHGDTQNPLRAGIVLCGGDGQREVLELGRLIGERLDQLDLAYLASCWSADSFVTPARVVLSLPMVMHLHGVRAVLGCLWELPDRIAPQIADTFYASLACGSTAGEALQQAVNRCRSLPGARVADWAGLVLFGDIVLSEVRK